ncbi:MAG: class I SAM-dependent methyltransferase [Burkholderiales bacterium]
MREPNCVSSDQARSLVRHTVVSLESIAGLERIWKRGVVHRGGPHYRLRGTTGPVSIGEDECLMLGKLIARFRPDDCFIIGNGFGLSSAFIAKTMEAYGGASVVTLDSKAEGDGELCFKTAEELRIRMDCRILRNITGFSPEDIEKTAEGACYDLVFIDGDHSHPQATNDFCGVRHLLRKDGILCWHDYWLEGVPESVEEAQRDGYRCLKVNSSCEMVFGTKDEAIFREIGKLFNEAEAPTRRSHPLARFKLSRSFLWGTIKAHLPAR